MHDLIVRGGRVVDGTGARGRYADVAIDGDRIAEVGEVDGTAHRIIDADGMLVMPGVVDIHTHYDGQITWDPLVTPSSWHGITTIVNGNCGVGFAPVRPGQEEWLIQLMEGVEDIPGSALSEGITWGWESFPDYLSVLEGTDRILDVGTQVPHGALRAYVMGERGTRNRAATPEDVASMANLVSQALDAGALGFSTSRTIYHRALDGEPVPGTFADDDELLGIGRVLGAGGRGVIEAVPLGILGEEWNPQREIAWMRKLSAATRRPICFAVHPVDVDAPEGWRELFRLAAEARASGADLRPCVSGRPVNILVGFQTSHLFEGRPTYQRIAHLPLAERVARLRTDEVRRSILSEHAPPTKGALARADRSLARMFPLGEPPNYEPPADASVAALAQRTDKSEEATLYDLMLQHDGRELLMYTVAGYLGGNLDDAREMLVDPRSVLGLADGGAHCGSICDAGQPTFMLTHWGRDRNEGRIPVEDLVRKMTSDTARLYGLNDRGVLAPGYKADLNVVDFDGLNLKLPEMVYDLPGGARRLVQRADGWTATICSGQVTLEDGAPTGVLPGRLIRGSRSGPAS